MPILNLFFYAIYTLRLVNWCTTMDNPNTYESKNYDPSHQAKMAFAPYITRLQFIDVFQKNRIQADVNSHASQIKRNAINFFLEKAFCT